MFTSERPHYSLALFSSFIGTCTTSKKYKFASKKTLDYFPKKYPVYANNWLVVTDSSESRHGERVGSSCRMQYLRGSLPKSGPLDFATKNTFPLFFVGEEALVGIY